jgi:hypothetical protein
MPAAERGWATANPEAGQPGPVPGWALEIMAGIGQIKDAQAGERKPSIPWDSCHPVPILGQISITSGAGSVDYPDMYGPHDPYWWDVRSIKVWGFTAGTVTCYLNSTNGAQVFEATAPGEFTGSATTVLGPRDRLIFSATGITGTVSFGGQAIEIHTAWLPEYLM